MMVQVIPDSTPWFFTAIYASNDFLIRIKLWEDLINFSKYVKGGWLVDADFNDILKANEKFEGRHIDNERSILFKQCLDNCNMVDLGFKGCKYTLTNKRYKNR